MGVTIYEMSKIFTAFFRHMTGLMIECKPYSNVKTSVSKRTVYIAARLTTLWTGWIVADWIGLIVGMIACC